MERWKGQFIKKKTKERRKKNVGCARALTKQSTNNVDYSTAVTAYEADYIFLLRVSCVFQIMQSYKNFVSF